MSKIPSFAVLSGPGSGLANPVSFGLHAARHWQLRTQVGTPAQPRTFVRSLGHNQYEISVGEKNRTFQGSEREAFEQGIKYHNYSLLWNAIFFDGERELFWDRKEGDKPRQEWWLMTTNTIIAATLAQATIRIEEKRRAYTENQFIYEWELYYDFSSGNGPNLRGDANDLVQAQFDSLMARQSYLEAIEEHADEPTESAPPSLVSAGTEGQIIRMCGHHWIKKDVPGIGHTYTLMDEKTNKPVEHFALRVNKPDGPRFQSNYELTMPTETFYSPDRGRLPQIARKGLDDRYRRIEAEWLKGQQCVVSINTPEISCNDAEAYLTTLQEASNLPPDDTSRTRETCATYSNNLNFGQGRCKVPLENLDCSAPKERVMLYVDPALKNQRDELQISLAIGVALITSHMSTPKTNQWVDMAKALLKPVKTIREEGFEFHVQATGNGYVIERETKAVVEVMEGSHNGHHTSMLNTITPAKMERLCVVLPFNEIRMLYFDSSEEAIALLEALLAGHVPTFGRLMRVEFKTFNEN